jgi:hypothetical protein
MNKFLPEARPAKRDAMCRACETAIPKGTPMISWYSYLNKGTYVHLHEECAVEIGNMAIVAGYERVKDES